MRQYIIKFNECNFEVYEWTVIDGKINESEHIIFNYQEIKTLKDSLGDVNANIIFVLTVFNPHWNLIPIIIEGHIPDNMYLLTCNPIINSMQAMLLIPEQNCFYMGAPQEDFDAEFNQQVIKIHQQIQFRQSFDSLLAYIMLSLKRSDLYLHELELILSSAKLSNQEFKENHLKAIQKKSYQLFNQYNEHSKSFRYRFSIIISYALVGAVIGLFAGFLMGLIFSLGIILPISAGVIFGASIVGAVSIVLQIQSYLSYHAEKHEYEVQVNDHLGSISKILYQNIF